MPESIVFPLTPRVEAVKLLLAEVLNVLIQAMEPFARYRVITYRR